MNDNRVFKHISVALQLAGSPVEFVPIEEEKLASTRGPRGVMEKASDRIPRDLMQVCYDGNSVQTVSPSTCDSPQKTRTRILGTTQYTIHSVLASAKVANSLPIPDLRASGVFTEIGELRTPHRINFHAGPDQRYMALFRNGTATVRGCRSIREARALLKQVRRTIAPLAKVASEEMPIFVQNIVASVDLGVSVDLAGVSETLASSDISYEPEQFPGLILRPKRGKVVVLVFASGKLVIVGSRSEDELAAMLGASVELLAEAFR